MYNPPPMRAASADAYKPPEPPLLLPPPPVALPPKPLAMLLFAVMGQPGRGAGEYKYPPVAESE